MANPSSGHSPRVLAGMAIGAVFGVIYFVCLAAMLYYTEMRDRQNDSLAFDLQAARHERARLRGLINEIHQDNVDLRALLDRSSSPRPYPASVDPTHDPRNETRH